MVQSQEERQPHTLGETRRLLFSLLPYERTPTMLGTGIDSGEWASIPSSSGVHPRHAGDIGED